MRKVLCIGSINMDLVINTKRMPQIGETINGESFKTGLGGKGANQAISASRLGLDVKMLGAVGNDIYGRELIDKLKHEKIGIHDIILSEKSTGVAMITVVNGDNFIILDSGANSIIDKKIIDESIELIKWADIVLFQLEIPLQTVLYGIAIAKKFQKTVIFNPAPMVEFDKEILKDVDILVVNKTEAEMLTQTKITSMKNAKECVKILNEIGTKQVIITLGNNGSVYNFLDEIVSCDIINTDVIDTTAAGDSFIGGICKGLSIDMSIDEAVFLATVVAGITVSKQGASDSLPHIDEVVEYMNNNI